MEPTAPVQLLVYRFPEDASYSGELISAVERLEVGSALRVLDAIFVRKEAGGELVAFEARGGEAGGMVGKALDFRFDALEGHAPALAGDAGTARGLLSRADVEEVGSALGPGEAAAFLFVEHAWIDLLDRANAQVGGVRVATQLVSA